MAITTNAVIAFPIGLQANLPSTAAGIAAALNINVAYVTAGMAFYCTDTGNLFVWSGTAMTAIGGSVASVFGRTGVITAQSGDYASFYDVAGTSAAETARAETAEGLLVTQTTTVNGHALSSNVVISASDLTTGTLPHAQLPALVSGDIPNNAANTSGTAAGLTGSPSITVNGLTCTTLNGCALTGTFTGNGTFSGALTFTGACLSTASETFGLATYTAGISNSPSVVFAGSYQSGASTYAEDSWTVSDVIGTGTNGTSVLTFTHSGTTGAAYVSVPYLAVLPSTNPCSIFYASNPTYGIDIGASGAGYWVNAGTPALTFGQRGVNGGFGLGNNVGIAWCSGAVSSTGQDVGIQRTSPGALQISSGTTANAGGALSLTGQLNAGGVQLQQFSTVVGTPTVTPTGGSATAYSYEVVALDVNLQPIGASAAGSTSTGAATLTTSAFNTVTWTGVAGAYAYAVYRSASAGTPATTGLMYQSTSLSGVSVTVSAGVSTTFTLSSVAIQAKFAGQLVTIAGCKNASNNGTFYCISSTATTVVLANLNGVVETAPASATLTGGLVPGATLTFVDYGWTANSATAPTTNSSGSLAFVSSYESNATGPSLSQDQWTIFPSVASGLNGASTLTFTHTGSTGTAYVSAPEFYAVGGFSLSMSGAATQGMLPSGASTFLRGTSVYVGNSAGAAVQFTGAAIVNIGAQATSGALGVTGVVYSNVTTGINAAFGTSTVFTTSAVGVYRISADVWPTTLSSTAWDVAIETTFTPNGATGSIIAGIVERNVNVYANVATFAPQTTYLASGATIGISLNTASGSNTSGVLSYMVTIERLA